jgi:brefeldin A-resistance guanine nucleotide exchange factor 1
VLAQTSLVSQASSVIFINKWVRNIPQRWNESCSIPADTSFFAGNYRENIALYRCSPETKEAMIEAFCVLVGIPGFMVEVFINYDSEVARGDLCKDITRTLCWAALAGKDSSAVCLDTLLDYIQSMYDRLDDQAQTEGFPSCNDLRKQRESKALIITGAQSFNENPNNGIAFLSTHGILENPDDAAQVAQFLKTTSRLSKKAIGEFISERTNEDVLNAFVNLHDFSGRFIVDALRELLSAIRLPGEAPLIERIMTSFSNKYIKDNESDLLDIADTDSLFVLAYAIIMLNTSLYNPNIKQVDRMSYEDFSKNLRGLNAGEDFAPDFQRKIYNNIQQREIIVPDEHGNRDAFNHAWAEVLSNSASAGGLVVGETNLYDADMVNATWKPLVATLSHLLSTSDYNVYSRAAVGLDQCARLAARYGASKMFDAIISSLSSISTLATDMPIRITFNIEVQGVMVSELAVRFGHDLRAQLTTVILFRVLASNTATVRDSWRPIVQILRNLFINSLIPSFVHSSENGLDLPPISLQEDPDSNRTRTTTGLLSSVKSYIASYVADDLPEPSKEELDSTCYTVDCLRACLIDSVLSSIQQVL